jgi:hypothetical protein
MNILFSHCNNGNFRWRPVYVLLLPAMYICHIGIVVPHSVFLYSWQCHVAEQHTHNTLLYFHCYNAYVNASHCYIICTLPVLFCMNITVTQLIRMLDNAISYDLCLVHKLGPHDSRCKLLDSVPLFWSSYSLVTKFYYNVWYVTHTLCFMVYLIMLCQLRM